MSTKPFQFKQFTVNQDKCAMKIGTDAVLLGSWTDVSFNPDRILDIGSGTGILALMMAQRSPAMLIDAIELEDLAFEQCVENFENSSWSDRLFCYHSSIQEFTDKINEKYDLIICNPPFYQEDYQSNDIKRNKSRFNDSMPFKSLIRCVSHLLSNNGFFSVIVPFSAENTVIDFAYSEHLFPSRILRLKGNPTTKTVRSLIEFSFQKSDIHIEELIIETSRHQYTKDYIELTKDFYLKM